MPDLEFENKYYPHIVAGVDEAGRGPLVGPVFAASVIIDPQNIIEGLNDSKKLSSRKREELYARIINNYEYGIGQASCLEIDEFNILNATKLACQRAVANMSRAPAVVLVDGNMKFNDERFISIVKGDQLSASIAAASIVAKVARDRLLTELAREFPQYGWEKNKGYGAKDHVDAILAHGYTSHHRRSFKLKNLESAEL